MTLLLMLALVALIACAALVLPRIRTRRIPEDPRPLVERIDALLPQTQCGQCGEPGCLPYARAIAEGRADINRCPPGGDAGIRKLADLLGRDIKPLADDVAAPRPRRIALIDESLCIGCTLCIQACPVDAILGAAKMMHTVLADECTGCELCVAPCPVDCISMRTPDDPDWRWPYPVIPLVKAAPRDPAA